MCIAIREWTPGNAPGSAGIAVGRVTASSDAYQRVQVSYVAAADDNTIAVHVFRWADDIQAGEAFLADAITLVGDDAGGEGQRAADARCA